MSTTLTAERVVKAHIKIKAERDAFVKQTDLRIAEYDAKLLRLENHLLGVLNQQGQDSFHAAGKVVYRHKDLTPSGADWPAIYRWIKTRDAWDMLERRIKKTFIADYMEANKGGIPPGVNVMFKYSAKIRALPKKKDTLTDGE